MAVSDTLSLFSQSVVNPDGTITNPVLVAPLTLTFGLGGPPVLLFTQNAAQTGTNRGLIDFAPALPGKEANAGRIGYEAFSTGQLDIVGAGIASSVRSVRVWDNLIVGNDSLAAPGGSIEAMGVGAQLRLWSRDTPQSGSHVLYVPNGFGGNILSFFDANGLGQYFFFSARAGQNPPFGEWGEIQGCGGGFGAPNGRGRFGATAVQNGVAYMAGNLYNQPGGWSLENPAQLGGMFYVADNSGPQAYVYPSGLALQLACSFGNGWGADGGAAAFHASAFTVSSDKRFKKNIRPLSDALAIVRKLKGVSFDWKEIEARPLPRFADGVREVSQRQIGFIADDVEQVVPEVVTHYDKTLHQQHREGAGAGDGPVPEGSGWKGLDYNRLIPLLVEAVKELAAEVDQLKEASV